MHRRILRFAVACASISAAAVLARFSVAQERVDFTNDFAAAKARSAQTGTPIFIKIVDTSSQIASKFDKDAFTNAAVVKQMRRFIPVNVPARGGVANSLQYDGRIGFLILNYKGEEVHRIPGYYDDIAYFAEVIQREADKAESAIIDVLEKEAAGKNAAAALIRLGQFQNKRAAEILMAKVKDEAAPETVRKAAMTGVAKLGVGADELVGLVSHKSPGLRAAAATSLQQMGPVAGTAVLTGLDSDNPDTRAALHRAAVSITKYTKARTPMFWKSGSADERSLILAEWKTWWQAKMPK